MKKIYMLIVLAVFSGQIMAQSTKLSTTSTADIQSVSKQDPSNKNESSTTFSKVDLPGFPVYQSTGNKELDDANYATAKENWINANQATYDAYIGQTSPVVNYKAMPGFPQFIDTGNPDADKATYIEAKKKWFEANPQPTNNSTK
jgi:hypothetical protein